MRLVSLILVLTAVVRPLQAEVFECVDTNGKLLFTNEKMQANDCKALNVSPPNRVPSSSTQAAAAAPSIEDLTQMSAARDDPDPSNRLQAIEDWARGPQENLDPPTYALVDPDESVRLRAQELVERVWAAKADAEAR